MIVVGAGSSLRFGRDKLLTQVGGLPLVVHSIKTIKTTVDRCILVHRADQGRKIASLRLGVDLIPGGDSRTGSELAGLAALEDDYELIGIHDAARPLVSTDLIEKLFQTAGSHGGAIPVVSPDGLIVDRESLEPVSGVVAAQTPQVFESGVLREAFRLAAETGFEGHDTAEVVQRFTDCVIAGVPGESANMKITYPEDLHLVEEMLEASTRIAPR